MGKWPARSGRRFSTCGIPAGCTAPLGAAHAPSPDAHSARKPNRVSDGEVARSKWPQVFNLRCTPLDLIAPLGAAHAPSPDAHSARKPNRVSDGEVARSKWPQVFNLRCTPLDLIAPLGAAHAPSPDAHYGHPALRSLGVSSASPSWLAEETNAGSRGTGNPELRALIGLGFQPRCLATAKTAPQLATPPARMAGILTQAATATMAWQPYVGRRPTCLPRLPRPGWRGSRKTEGTGFEPATDFSASDFESDR
jgi:hypothetical protein